MVNFNRKYYILGLITFLLFMMFLLIESNFFNSFKYIILGNELNEKFMIFFGEKATYSISERLYVLMDGLINIASYDYLIVFTTYIFQVLIPIFSLIGIIDFYSKYNTIFKFKLNNTKRYLKYILKHIFNIANKTSIAIFIPYVLLMIILYFVQAEYNYSTNTRYFLLDIFGEDFYNYTYLYYFIEGSIRFYLVPFIYTCFGQAIVLLFNNLKYPTIIPLAYYYGLSSVGSILSNYIEDNFIYFSPSVIMASGSYENFNSILLILINMLPLFIGIFIMIWRCNKFEI